MQLVGRLHHAATAIFLLFGTGNTSTITTAPRAHPTSISTQTCESRTINYLTDSLPPLCLKSTWAQANGIASRKVEPSTDGETNTAGLNGSSPNTGHGEEQNATSIEAVAGETATSSPGPSQTSAETAEASPTDIEEAGELSDAAFLSFEEWKKLTLEKSGQQNSNIGGKRSGENKNKDSDNFSNNLDSLGEEGEIDLDFGAFKTGRDVLHKSTGPQTGESNNKQENHDREVKKKDHYRSKDAGKTCKERNSYASFDVGAKIVKTHRGAKNAKAVLVENKDSYMLSECTTNDKFLIIELSEDIWIDTVVLANYEFFSSMIREFRVSLSDKWPVKTEKWKVVGTYEARNSREIQAFLIENPQIWARYIRIEFLTHYGTEYYCPLSLVRVHGTRMLESWRETEANNDEEEDDDDSEDVETIGEDRYIPEAVADTVLQEEKLQAELREAQAAIENLVKEADEITATFAEPSIDATHLGEAKASLEEALIEQMSTPWIPDFDFGAWMNVSQGLDVCLLKEAPTPKPPLSVSSMVETVASITSHSPEATGIPDVPIANNTVFTTAISLHAEASTSSEIAPVETSSVVVPNSSTAGTSQTSNSTITTSTPTPSPVTPTSRTQNPSSAAKTKASATQSSPSALPTQQESFFKAVSRRLQLLESNSTLSLKYIEEQSRTLREAFSKVEKKQLQKTTTFLDAINATLFTELKQIRQQYDEIWQSTVISLESQREESKKEIFAITSRLNILADEVVFQKRMSIVQSVLLLLCLGLVIFSRVSTNSPIEYPLKSRFLNFSIESPTDVSLPGSPEYIMPEDEMPNGRHEWVGNGHARQRSDDSIVSLEEGNLGQYDEDESPPTPISAYSHSDPSLSPPSGNDTTTPYFPVSSSPTTTPIKPTIPIRISSYTDGSEAPVRSNSKPKQQSNQDSPVRQPKKKKPIIYQRQSPPAEETNLPTNGISLSSPPVVPPRTHLPQAHNHNHRNVPVSPEAQGRSRHRTSGGSFSIARKPLPALPDEG